jgi:hypothetical protein
VLRLFTRFCRREGADAARPGAAVAVPEEAELEEALPTMMRFERRTARTLHGLCLRKAYNQYARSRRPDSSPDFSAESASHSWLWAVIQCAVVTFHGAVLLLPFFFLFEVGTRLQALYLRTTWAFDPWREPISRLSWREWLPHEILFGEPGAGRRASPEVGAVLGCAGLLLTLGWLRSLCAFADTDRTLQLERESRYPGGGSQSKLQRALRSNARKVLSQLAQLLKLAVQTTFVLVILGIAVCIGFVLLLVCQWMLVAAIVKPDTMLPLGTSVVTLWLAVVAVTKQMKGKAAQLRTAVRCSCEARMKRQFLVYERRRRIAAKQQPSLHLAATPAVAAMRAPRSHHLLHAQQGGGGGQRSRASTTIMEGGGGGDPVAARKELERRWEQSLKPAAKAGPSVISEKDVAEVEPRDVFLYFCGKDGVLSKGEFDDIFRSLGWKATAVERDQMFAHCDTRPHDISLDEEEWTEGWESLIDFHVRRGLSTLGLSDTKVALAVLTVALSMGAFMAFILLAVSAFFHGDNFIATVQSIAIAGQGTAITALRSRSKGEDEANIQKESAKAASTQ